MVASGIDAGLLVQAVQAVFQGIAVNEQCGGGIAGAEVMPGKTGKSFAKLR